MAEAGLSPPTTWEAYLEIAENLHDRDFDGDEQPDYGSCLGKASNADNYELITAIASPLLQRRGSAQGLFFDLQTFEPLVNNQGFITALERYRNTANFGPPNEVELDGFDTQKLFLAGRCALTVAGGEFASAVIKSDQSTVKDKVGAVILPGSSQIVDFSSGQLIECTPRLCPHAIDGINHAPLSTGGWVGAVNARADTATKAIVYEFLSYLSQPAQSNVDVVVNRPGFNAYRTSQFFDRQPWVDVGLSPAAASNYLAAVEQSLSSTNMVLDLRIPQYRRYQTDVLDVLLSRYLADELSAEEAAQEIVNQWEAITEELGREQQLAIYRASLGIKE